MKRSVVKVVAMLLTVVLMLPAITGAVALTDVSAANTGSTSESTYILRWMKPYSIVTYDSNLNRTVVQGGYLSQEELETGFYDPMIIEEPDMIAAPNTKVTYDSHGFIQNIYYKTPGTQDSYQLRNPKDPRNGTGWIDAGESVTYGSYKNYDTGASGQTCTISRATGAQQIQCRGRITFYVGGPTGEMPSHNLEYYDCATKMYYCDVPSGTTVYAKNTYTNSSTVTFYKWDCGGLPSAILDVWSDSGFNPITDLTTTGSVDNVYSAYVWLFAPYNS